MRQIHFTMEIFYTFRHSAMQEMAKDYLKRKNKAVRWFNIALALQMVVIGYLVGTGIAQESFASANMSWLLGGPFLVLLLVLLPLHEVIHALAYKYFGAPKIQFRMHWKKAMVMTEAPGFLIAARPFVVVALAPAVIISMLLILVVIFTPFLTSLFTAVLLFLHTLCCGGDMALVSFCLEHSDKNLWTKDDPDEAVSYFYSANEKTITGAA